MAEDWERALEVLQSLSCPSCHEHDRITITKRLENICLLYCPRCQTSFYVANETIEKWEKDFLDKAGFKLVASEPEGVYQPLPCVSSYFCC